MKITSLFGENIINNVCHCTIQQAAHRSSLSEMYSLEKSYSNNGTGKLKIVLSEKLQTNNLFVLVQCRMVENEGFQLIGQVYPVGMWRTIIVPS